MDMDREGVLVFGVSKPTYDSFRLHVKQRLLVSKLNKTMAATSSVPVAEFLLTKVVRLNESPWKTINSPKLKLYKTNGYFTLEEGSKVKLFPVTTAHAVLSSDEDSFTYGCMLPGGKEFQELQVFPSSPSDLEKITILLMEMKINLNKQGSDSVRNSSEDSSGEELIHSED